MRTKTTLLVMAILTSISCNALNYFWVGGSGTWSDLSHWSLSPGGGIFHSQVPQSTDNVFFDANSFNSSGQTVTVDQTIVQCADMNWTGVTHTPVFSGDYSNTLRIYGSLSLAAGMTNNFNGQISMETPVGGQTITTAGQILNNTLIFNGIGGEWILQDALTLSDYSSIFFYNGTLNTNNQTVNVSSFEAYSSAFIKTLTLGSSIFNFSDHWYIQAASTISINAGTSTIKGTDLNSYPTSFLGGGLTYNDLSFVGSGQIYDNNTFHTVTFSKNGTIFGSNTYDNLNFLPGYTYILPAGLTQTINTSLNVNGNCGALIGIVKSSTLDVQANISKASGNVTVSYVTLKDINATGGASFTANNSLDLGNNTGWTINPLPSKNLYWVGNAGNWGDGNHWSTASGGAPSGCSPTPVDNVFFDANSFSFPGQTVTINVPTAYCNNMTWSGISNVPTLYGDYSGILKIYGSLTLATGMNFNYIGPISFEATSGGKTITTAGNVINTSLTFNGIGGEWTLQDALTLNNSGYIYLNNGTLNTNNQTVNANSFSSYTSSARTLIMGSSTFNLSGDYTWLIQNSSGMTLNAGTSTINSTTTGIRAHFGSDGLTYHDVFFASGATLSGNNTFHDVTISKNGTINGSNTFDNLTFSPGYTYILPAGQTQTINTSLNVNGNCGALIGLIKSSDIGSQATISKASGTVTVSYATLKDINATGGASFIANNAIDLGNNTGWTINAMLSKNLYWIGNGGNWGDGSHWSASSGGAPSGCSPTAVDNVFFDANSFSLSGQTVTVNVPNFYFNNMNWTGVTNTPTLYGDYSSTMKLYGSLTLAPGMNYNYIGPVNFEATTTGQTISTAGKVINAPFIFNGIGGGWTLQDDLTLINNRIELNNGSLNTNNQTVKSSDFESSTSFPRTLTLGSSTFNFSGYWVTQGAGMTLNAGTSTIVGADPNGNESNFYGGGFTYNDAFFAGDAKISQSNIFHTVTIEKNGTINDNNTFDNLVFSPGYTYTLPAGQTQTVGNICAQGNGALPIRIQSSVAGNPATISKANGTICWDYVRVSDISTTGGATFNAGLAPTNSQDMGGNTGLLFTGGCTPVSCPCTSPNITSQPVNKSVCAGNMAVFEINAFGSGLTYQWQVDQGTGFTNLNNTAPYSGVTSKTLNITSATTGMSGYQYRCVLTGTCAPISTSNAAMLTVNQSPIIIVNSATICSGQTATLSASGAASYFWLGGGGSNTNSITVSPILTTSYMVMGMTGGCTGMAFATVTVNLLPSVSTNSSTICSGQTATLTASGAVNYVWSIGGMMGDTTNPISVSPVTTTTYTVTGTSNGCSNTAIATVTVNPLPMVTASVSSSTVTVSATGGTPPYTGTGIFTGLAAGTYSYTVTDANGCSATTTVTVTEPSGSNCASAKPLTNSLLCPVYSAAANEISWYKFTPDSTNCIIIISAVYDSTNLQNNIRQADLYSGDCTNLTLLQSTNNNTLKTLFLQGEGLSTQQTYFLKIFNDAVATNYSVGIENRAPLTACENKITNGGFEASSGSPHCPPPNTVDESLYNILLAPPWTNGTNPSTGGNSSDYWNPGGSNNPCIYSNLLARTGSGAAGIYSSAGNLTPQTGLYREYIVAPTLPLINGATYRFEFYYKSEPLGNPIIDMGVVIQTSNSGLSNPFNLSPLPKIETLVAFGWRKVTSFYTYTGATGTSAYFAIGDYRHTPMGPNDSDYRFVDDVSMVESPNVVINGSLSFCSNNPPTLTASNGSNFTWTCNPTLPGFPHTGATVTIAGPFTSSSYTLTLTAITPSGCTSISEFPLSVTQSPATPVLSGANYFCQGSSTILHVNTNFTSTIQWFLNGSPISGATGASYTNYTVITPGIYSVRISYTGGGCPTFSNSITVSERPLPNAIATPNPSTICSGSVTSITLHTSSGVPGTTFAWTVAQFGVSGATSGIGSNINQILTTTGVSQGGAAYTVTPAANGCTGNSITVLVNVNPTPTVEATPASQTWCSGTGINQINISNPNGVFGTTFTWTRDNISNLIGIATSGTGTSITGTLYNNTGISQTTIFTVTPTANGCQGVSKTVTVTVNPLPIVSASASSGLICPGAATTLTATATSSAPGAFSYIWNPGNLTGASITVNPITATTYYVIATDGNGCSKTASVSVDVRKLTVNSPAAICAESNQTVILTASGATNYTWAPSTGLNVANGSSVIAHPNSTTTYTVTGTSNTNTCVLTATVTVTVLPCCTYTGWPNYAGYTASGGTFTGNFTINGIFTVTGNVTFNNATDVKLGPNAKIHIKPGARLTIKNSHLHACTDMWEGIYIDGPTALGGANYGRLVINTNSIIEDAKNAVYTANGGRLQITNSTFDHNYKSVVVSGGFYYYNSDAIITNSSFKCSSTLRVPYAGQHSFAHIYLNINNSNLVVPINTYIIGSTSLPNGPIAISGNKFLSNVDYAIWSKESSASIGTNNFNFPTNATTTSIYSDSYSYSTIIGRIIVTKNKFNGGLTGVYSKSNKKIEVTKNDFNNQKYGVTIQNCGLNNGLYNYLTVGNNTFTNPVNHAVAVYNNPYAYKQINHNIINFSPGFVNGSGIFAFEITPPTNPKGSAQIFYNTINNARTGIWTMNLNQSHVVSNTISLEQSPAGQYAYGILAQNSINGAILTNTVADCTQDWWINGIRVGGSAMKVGCNTLGKLGYGLFFDGNMMPNTHVIHNSMSNEGTGLIISYGAIGPQGVLSSNNSPDATSENRWYGTYSAANPKMLSNYSDGTLSPFVVKNVAPYKVEPAYNIKFPILPQYSVITVTPTSPGVSQYPPNCSAGSTGPVGYGKRLALAKAVIMGNINYPVLDAQSKWISKDNLHKNLVVDTAFLNSDPALVSFKTNTDNSNMGVLANIAPVSVTAAAGENQLSLPGNTDLANAVNSLQTIIPANDIESNLKNVYSILLQNHNNGLSFTASDSSTLNDIANKCPYSDGPAVYMARAALNISTGVVINYMNNCENAPQANTTRMMIQNQTATAIDKTKFIIYPNPNDGNMMLDYSLDATDKGEIMIYDIAGKLIYKYELDASANQIIISHERFNNGIYFYRIKVNDKIVQSDKIVIVK